MDKQLIELPNGTWTVEYEYARKNAQLQKFNWDLLWCYFDIDKHHKTFQQRVFIIERNVPQFESTN